MRRGGPACDRPGDGGAIVGGTPRPRNGRRGRKAASIDLPVGGPRGLGSGRAGFTPLAEYRMFDLFLWLRRAAWLWLLIAPLRLLAADAGQGHLDAVQVQDRQMAVAGWAVAAKPQIFLTNVIVRVAGREVYRGRMQRVDRPDVAEALQRPEWRGSGFSARFLLPRDLAAGVHPIEVAMRSGEGQEFALPADAAHRQVDIPPWPHLTWPTLLALVLAAALPLGVLAASFWPAAARRAWGQPRGLAGAMLASFALLVSTGLTGSSLGLLLQPPAVTSPPMPAWAGTAQAVRSDEWRVITPLALAQVAHTPRWPVVNRNLGEDGQNMLAIGMAGVPVAHLSALAKPATWGFFAFDLPRALAWYWWLPIFGSLGALGWLLHRLMRLDWRAAAALGAAGTLAPYSVGFSHWPAYLCLFAALGLVAFERLLHNRRPGPALAWGLLLGGASAGYALVLYPAWQVSVATLCAPLALAWAWRERAHWRWGWPQSAGALVALATVAVLLGSWWLDVRETVAVIQGTVYPGQRATEAGGDIDRWFLMKGWLNPLTLYLDEPMVRSEAASCQFLWLAPFAALGWRTLQTRRVDAVAACVAAFALFALGFQFVGFPAWLARATGWGVVTSYRLDLALGLAQLLLLAWWLALLRDAASAPLPRAAVTAVLGASALLAAWEVARMPLDISSPLPSGWLMLAAAAAICAAGLWLRGRQGAFLALYVGWTLAAVLPFHPLVPAPGRIELAAPLQAAGLTQGEGESPRHRTAVVDAHSWITALPAAGVPVVNSVFYAPQTSLWQRLDPHGERRLAYNRFQHLLLELGPQPPGRTFTLVAPRLDAVRVTLDPERFDFRLLNADHVVLPRERADALMTNPTLARVDLREPAAPYALFKVRAR